MHTLLLVKKFFPLLLQGVSTTIQLWVFALIISFIIGVTTGIIRSSKLRVAHISIMLDGIMFVLQAVPLYVQLLTAYFVIPSLLEVDVSAFSTALFSLGLGSASSVSQFVRRAIDEVPVGQWEAARVLGYSTLDTVRFIIAPQTCKTLLPLFIGEYDQLLKTTPIASAIGVLELTGAGRNIIAQEMNSFAMYMVVASIYLIMSAIIRICSAAIEKKLQQ